MPQSLLAKVAKQQWSAHYSRSPRRRYSQTKDTCRRNKTQFLLSEEEFLELCTRPCFYCNKIIMDSGSGLDRVDNTIGYMITNVVPCCGHCNWMKKTMTFQMFMDKIKLVYKNLLAKGLISKDIR